jgi:colanic acid biosynthesis protein WcaH
MLKGWIPDDDWWTTVANVPIVSVDLLIRTDEGLLFDTRTNEPAKGYWFPADGHVRKGETRAEAVHRVAREECGLAVEIVESLRAFEHIYETADVTDVDGKHYLANGYVVDHVSGDLTLDDQHDTIRLFALPRSHSTSTSPRTSRRPRCFRRGPEPASRQPAGP